MALIPLLSVVHSFIIIFIITTEVANVCECAIPLRSFPMVSRGVFLLFVFFFKVIVFMCSREPLRSPTIYYSLSLLGIGTILFTSLSKSMVLLRCLL